MKVAVIGSRSITDFDLDGVIPPEAEQIISGGAPGVDRLAGVYARAHGLPLTVIRPDYARYRRGAPLRRNQQIVDSADLVIAIWDGASRGTASTIDYARRQGREIRVIRI